MHPAKDFERIAYYRQQASACGAAALVATADHVKQAYLYLEHGWLCLVPNPEQRFPAAEPVLGNDPALPVRTAEPCLTSRPSRV